jgi:hypothetical protein
MIGAASEKSVYMLADSLVSALKDPHIGGHRRRHREQMQRFILAQHEDQGSPRLLHCHGDGTIGEALAQLTDPGLHRFRVCSSSPLPLLRSHSSQAPHMLFIRPIDAYDEGSELRLLLNGFDF